MVEGRDAEVLLFEATLNLKTPESPTDPRVVYFHGPNGIGKSALMQHLRNVICPSVYERARAASADPRPWLTRQARQGSNRMNAKQVAFAYLDFEHDGNGVECPMIGAVGLYAIARQLAKFNVVCPLFTVACFAHFKAWARATDKRDFALLRTEELKAINAIWEAGGGNDVPGAKMVLALLDLLKKHGNRVLDKVTEQDDLKKRIESISQMDPAGELARHLPDLLAEDLNRAVGHELGPARIVLLFDSHDAFWRSNDLPSRSNYYHLHDEWLRRLLRRLDRSTRITAVVAGRRKPLWSVSPRYPIADTELQSHEIQGLNAAQGEHLLLTRGLKRLEIEAAIKEARDVTGPGVGIHPATLLAVAAGQALPESPVDRLEWLIGHVYERSARTNTFWPASCIDSPPPVRDCELSFTANGSSRRPARRGHRIDWLDVSNESWLKFRSSFRRVARICGARHTRHGAIISPRWVIDSNLPFTSGRWQAVLKSTTAPSMSGGLNGRTR